MNSVILCEGFDDVLIIGYYLFKTDRWTYEKDGKLSGRYDFPKVKFRNQLIEVYKRGNDSLAIWCVGGKNSFEKPFDFIKNVNERHPKEGFQQVFILSDRDDYEIDDCLEIIKNKMIHCGLPVGNLENNKSNKLSFEVENEVYELNIIPIIIPFEETGAIETVLMAAVAETGSEDEFVVTEAKNYVGGLLHSGRLTKYLQHDRQIIKAKFSSLISITNPDRSTALFDALLMSFPWEETETIKKHFKILNKLL